MHFSHVVALAGDIEPEDVQLELDNAMEGFSEHLEVEPYLHMTRAEMMAEEGFTEWWHKQESMDYATAVQEWDGHDVDAGGDVMSTFNPDARWDWWVVGGRWGSEWTLREGAPDGPLTTEPSSFGYSDRRDENPLATDCARWRDLIPESITPPYSWLDLDGEWHTKWLGSDGSGSQNVKDWTRGEEFGTEFMKFLTDLPPDAWLIHLDYHT